MFSNSRMKSFATAAMVAMVCFTLGGCATPRPAEAIRTSGDNYMRAGDYDAARDEYAEIVSRFPGDWEAQYKLGVCCLQTEEYSAARRSLEIAHARMPHNQDVANALAEAMFQQGDESRLFAFLRERASRTQNVADYQQLARYSAELNDPDSARVAIDTAIEIDNSMTTEPYLEAARLAERLGNLDEAVRRLRQAYGINPNDVRVRERLREMGEEIGKVTPLPPGK